MTDYEWYLQSCANNGIKPLSEQRFAVYLNAYQTRFGSLSTHRFAGHSLQSQVRHLRRWYRMLQIAQLADAGRNVITAGSVYEWPTPRPTARAAAIRPPAPDELPAQIVRPSQDDGPPTDGAPGVREPRRPLVPVLAGSAARSYPPAEAPNWAAI